MNDSVETHSDECLATALIPRPAQCEFSGIDLHLPLPVSVFAPAIPEFKSILETFIGEIAPVDGIPMRLTEAPQNHDDPIGIEIEIKPDYFEPEAYELSVTPGGIRIITSSPPGLFYGLHTWLQLCRVSNEEVVITGTEITDKPRFAWRGMHLDVSRHFFPVSVIKKYINLLACHKMNIFHWHLCDDQGWRIDIPDYPRLTEVGAWRTEDGRRYGGFYRQDEIAEIVDFAQKRCVTIIPEIEMPGHAMAVLAAYPEFSCTGGPFEVPSTWGVFDDVYCAGNEKTFAFLETILSDVASLFPGPMIHIGGDECPKKRWHAHELCQERMRKEGLADEDSLQAYFIRRIAEYLGTLNKRLIGWDEILDGGAPAGSIIMAWRDIEKGSQAAWAGHDVIVCPMSHCYFDHYQAESEDEPKAIGGFTPLDTVYSFEPIPDDLPPELHGKIIGAQGNVWTEYMPDSDHVEYMAFPRLCALAEVLWTPRTKRLWNSFIARLRPHLKRLERIGVNYRRSEFL